MKLIWVITLLTGYQNKIKEKETTRCLPFSGHKLIKNKWTKKLDTLSKNLNFCSVKERRVFFWEILDEGVKLRVLSPSEGLKISLLPQTFSYFQIYILLPELRRSLRLSPTPAASPHQSQTPKTEAQLHTPSFHQGSLCTSLLKIDHFVKYYKNKRKRYSKLNIFVKPE
jgi:hypothetical protein